MRPEDIARMKHNLLKKRKATTVEGASKKLVVCQEEAVDDQSSLAEAITMVAASISPSPLQPATISISAVPLIPVYPPLVAPAPTSPTFWCGARVQPFSIAGPSRLSPLANQMDLDSRLSFIPGDATFDDWKVVEELIERSILLVELRRIGSMDFNDLQWNLYQKAKADALEGKELEEAIIKIGEDKQKADNLVTEIWWEAKNQVAKAKLEAGERIADAYRAMVEVFKVSMDFKQKKTQMVDHYKESKEFHDVMVAFKDGEGAKSTPPSLAPTVDQAVAFLDPPKVMPDFLSPRVSIIGPLPVASVEKIMSRISDLERKVKELNRKVIIQGKKLSKAKKVFY
ncbi:hypothetical protein COCNU_09G000210 [Cocos nucifera]|uniref:Uncharacterized protein n=1 Tax=Cocos nucifera TaxID=13894 RepID=A0A8K0N6Y4_COCNU|nr:hypothetical protein COCNU_09G000210 [Cocos nucifera]